MDTIAKKKKELLTSSERYKRAISHDLNALSTRTENLVADGLITVGVLLSAIAVYRLLSSKNEKKPSSTASRLVTVFKEQSGLYILNEGRKNIVEYLNSLDEKES